MAFTTDPNQFKFKNNLNDLQKKRHKDHIATVTVDENGKFDVSDSKTMIKFLKER